MQRSTYDDLTLRLREACADADAGMGAGEDGTLIDPALIRALLEDLQCR